MHGYIYVDKGTRVGLSPVRGPADPSPPIEELGNFTFASDCKSTYQIKLEEVRCVILSIIQNNLSKWLGRTESDGAPSGMEEILDFQRKS